MQDAILFSEQLNPQPFAHLIKFLEKSVPNSRRLRTMDCGGIYDNCSTHNQHCCTTRDSISSPRTQASKESGLLPVITIRHACESSLSSSSSSSDDSSTMSTSSTSTSRRKRRGWRELQLRSRIRDRRRMESMIDRGFSLRCDDCEDDGSLSSLSGYGTDYSTSDGSIGFETPCEISKQHLKGFGVPTIITGIRFTRSNTPFLPMSSEVQRA